MYQYDFWVEDFVVPIMAKNSFNAIINFMSYRIKKDMDFSVKKVCVWNEERTDITKEARTFIADVVKCARG